MLDISWRIFAGLCVYDQIVHDIHMLHVWYIYLHDWLIFRANVGKYTRKYTSTMEHMGYCITMVIAHPDFWWDTDPKIGFRTCARKGLEKDAPLLGTVSDKKRVVL